MGRKVFVVGVGMTKFEKPGSKAWDYPDMAREAGTKALADAGISYRQDRAGGGRLLLRRLHLPASAPSTSSGSPACPIYNVNNNCSTGSTALFMAKQFVEGGLADCTLALGFEKMEKGSLGMKFRTAPTRWTSTSAMMVELRGFAQAPGRAAVLRQRRPSSTWRSTARRPSQFAKIGQKNHKHSVNNPYSQFRDEYSLEDILNAPMVYEPLTKLQCCPTSDGAGAAILASEDFVKKHGLEKTAVEIAGMAMTTDFPSTFDEQSLHQARRRRHDAEGGREGLRAGGPRPRGRRRHRAARLLLVQRAHHLRRPRPLRAQARAASSSTRAPSPTAASGS